MSKVGHKDSIETRKKKSLSAKLRIIKYPYTKPNRPFEKGHEVPIEWRRKTSERQKGKSTWNKGKKLRPHTEEWKEKMSKIMTGKKHPPEFGKAISERMKGKPSLMKGIPRTEETKRKISLANKGKPRPQQRGEKNGSWKDGRTSLVLRIRHCLKYRQWRSSIFKRDNWSCVICGFMGYLEVDHYPKMFYKIIDEYQIKTLDDAYTCEKLWDIENGRTVCKKHNPRGKSNL